MTTYNTGNPIGSTEVKDLYDNAQNFDTLSTTTTLETVPDRLGVPRMSLHGFEQEAKRRFESIKFQPPIPYAPGIEVTTSSLTVDYLGVLYYPLPNALPFTTDAWNPAQWSPLQNTNPGNELLVFDDYAAASAAAATLPDGQAVVSDNDEVRGVVSGGAITAEQSIYKVSDYAKIRAYSGRGTRLRVSDATGAHWWIRSGSSADNGGTILVDALGRSWVREYSGAVQALWFGAIGTQSIQAAIDYVHAIGGGVVELPAGTIDLTTTASTETWETYAPGAVVATVGPGACALILRNCVTLQGQGIDATKLLTPANSGIEPIFVDASPGGYGIRDLTVDANWDLSTEINSHGIFWVTKTIADEANNVFADGVLFNVKVRRTGSYGFGVQHGVHISNLFLNCRTELTGADGIDVKSRQVSRGNRIIGMTVSAFGLRTSLVNQAGIDVRGNGWSVIAPRVVNFGRADTPLTGIRFNPGGGTNGNPASKSFVSDFIIEATNTNTRGVESYAVGATIGPGDIAGCSTGVWTRYSADSAATDNTVIGVTVDGAGSEGNAFASENASILRTRWISCTAKNISQGFRPAGTDDQIIGCAAENVTLPLSKAGSPVNLVVTSSPSLKEEQRAPAFLSFGPFNIPDDGFVLIDTSSSAYQQNALIGSASAGAGHPNGLFLFRSNSSPQCTNLAVQTTTNVVFTTGVMTGTTGVDGNFTISAASGGLYLENRTGATKSVVLTLFGDR